MQLDQLIGRAPHLDVEPAGELAHRRVGRRIRAFARTQQAAEPRARGVAQAGGFARDGRVNVYSDYGRVR